MFIPLSLLAVPATIQTQDPSWSAAQDPEPTVVHEFVSNDWVDIQSLLTVYSEPNEESLGYVQKVKPTARDKIAATLTSYLDLDEDWDGYGGVRPTDKAVRDTLEFLNALPEDKVPPKPMLAGSGEVGLFWDIEGFYCDVGFEGDGTYSYYGELNDAHSIGDEEVPVGVFPEELLNSVPRLSKS